MKNLFIVMFVLSGCAVQPMAWIKDGGSRQEFSQTNYECMQQAQQRRSDAYVNGYRGASQSLVVTNLDLFSACMNAHGFYLRPASELGAQ